MTSPNNDPAAPVTSPTGHLPAGATRAPSGSVAGPAGCATALLPAPVGFGLRGPVGWGDTTCADCGVPCRLYVEYVNGAAVPMPERSRCQSCVMDRDSSVYCRSCGGVDAHTPVCGRAS